jgi:hypothetical protein
MKKMSIKYLILIFICFTIVTACTLCLSNPADPSNPAAPSQPIDPFNIDIYGEEDLEKIQEFLRTYPVENAVASGGFVMVHGVVKEDSKKVWDTFYSNVKNKNDAAILILQYTIEGDPILNYVSFANDSFYSVTDISRDAWGGPVPYYSGSYKFLCIFEEEEQITTVMLCNIDYDTLEDYENDTQILIDIDDYDTLEDYLEDYNKHTEANSKKSEYLFSTWDI